MSDSKKAPAWAWILATGFGSGLLKPAPGTWGSLAALVSWVALIFTPWYLPGQPYRNAVGVAAWLLAPIITALAIWSSNRVVDETGVKDPSYVVADEWAGMWIALLPVIPFVQASLYFHEPWWMRALPLAVPFLLFRLFDILKPPPIYQLQSLPRGWGVVVDDVVAGIFAAILTAVAMRWFPTGPGKG